MPQSGPVFFGIVVATLIGLPRAAPGLLVGALIILLIVFMREEKFSFKPDKIDLCLAILAGWLAVSMIWSYQDHSIALSVLKTVTLLATGIVTMKLASAVELAKREHILDAVEVAAGIGLAIVLIGTVYALVVGDSLWGTYFSDPLTTLNSNAVIIALILWPVAVILSRKISKRWIGMAAITVLLLVAIPSMAAVFSVVVGCAILIARRYLGKKGGIIIASTLSLLIMVAPYVVQYSEVEDYTKPSVVNDASSDVPYSVRHRFAIWSFAVEKIAEKPWFGWGFRASRYIPQEDHRLAPNMEILPLHPHNLALQTRLELGLPGSLILSALTFLVFYRLATFTDNDWHSGLAMAPAASWLFVANVSYGMWQSWWIATAFLLFIIMRIVLASLCETEKTSSEN